MFSTSSLIVNASNDKIAVISSGFYYSFLVVNRSAVRPLLKMILMAEAAALLTLSV
jgi:hypothetical protein